MSPRQEPASQRLHVRSIAALTALGALLRWPGLFSNLHVDEVWSLRSAFGLDAWHGVFHALHTDNNHHLNSLFLWFLGPGHGEPLYRSLSFVTSVASIPIAALVTRELVCSRRLGLEAVVVAALVAGCYPLSFYASEARGYAALTCFGLLALLSLWRYLDRGGVGHALCFALTSSLALLSQLVFLHLLGAMLLQVLVEWRSLTRARRIGLVRMLAVPVALLELLWFIDLHALVVAGGVTPGALTVYVGALSLAVGGPTDGPGAAVLASLVIALVLLVPLRPGRLANGDALPPARGRALLLVSAIVLVPLLVTLVTRPTATWPRYYIIPMLLLQLPLGLGLARMLAASRPQRLFAGVLLLALLAGHGLGFADLWRNGRGQYRQALAEIGAVAGGAVVRVGSEHDLRHGSLVRYYAPSAMEGAKLRYVERAGSWPADGVDFWIVERTGSGPPAERTRDPHGLSYRLFGSYPTNRLDGFHWLVYERAGRGRR